MIIVRLFGGLGNQLFQYALGRSLAVRNDTELVVDTSWYGAARRDGEEPRRYSLEPFRITAREASPEDFAQSGLNAIRAPGIAGKLKRKWLQATESLKPLSKRSYILEPHFQFAKEVYEAGPTVYLSGNWQSERYFSDSEALLRAEFTLKEPLSPKSTAWLEKIQHATAVSIHIRRGDYVQDTKTNQLHGLCSPAYYASTLNELTTMVGPLEGFVFSDDIAWAKEHLKGTIPLHFVSDGTLPDYEELVLMSSCRHAIIANSSFSWWGAWLNTNPNKIIIAPKQWFAAGNIDTSDLIPPSWLTR